MIAHHTWVFPAWLPRLWAMFDVFAVTAAAWIDGYVYHHPPWIIHYSRLRPCCCCCHIWPGWSSHRRHHRRRRTLNTGVTAEALQTLPPRLSSFSPKRSLPGLYNCTERLTAVFNKHCRRYSCCSGHLCAVVGWRTLRILSCLLWSTFLHYRLERI